MKAPMQTPAPSKGRNRVLVFSCFQDINRLAACCTSSTISKTPPEEIRHLDEEDPAVAMKAPLQMRGERAEAVVVEIVVVARIKSGSGIGSPPGEKLPAHVGRERVVIYAGADE
jgi:hypothetical protein